MAVFTLEDQAGGVEVVVYPEPFKQFAGLVENDRMLLVTGRVEVEDDRAKIRATEIKEIKTVAERLVKEVCVSVSPRRQARAVRASRGTPRGTVELPGEGRRAAAARAPVARPGRRRRADLRSGIGRTQIGRPCPSKRWNSKSPSRSC